MDEKREAYAFEPLDVFCIRKSITQFKYLVVEGSVASSRDQGQRSRSFFFIFDRGGVTPLKALGPVRCNSFLHFRMNLTFDLERHCIRFSTISRFHILNVLQNLKNS